jgi:hypothetical protein
MKGKKSSALIFLCALLITPNHGFSKVTKVLGGKKVISIDEVYYKDTDRWLPAHKNSLEAVTDLVTILEKSKTGKKILEAAKTKAAEYGETLTDVIKAGEGSLTDTTLTRRFSSSAPDKVVFESKSVVMINKDLNVVDAVLDLAHELTHFNFREPFNPYSTKFKLSDFVASTVEGRGGEVEAFLVECQVLFEIFPHYAKQRGNCERMLDSNTGKLSKAEGIKHFYRVGSYLDTFKRKVRSYDPINEKQINEGPLAQVSANEALFISSAWGLPYPVAAVEEFVSIMERVCENDQRRLNLMQAQRERSPASVEVKDNYSDFHSDYQKRCQAFKYP